MEAVPPRRRTSRSSPLTWRGWDAGDLGRAARIHPIWHRNAADHDAGRLAEFEPKGPGRGIAFQLQRAASWGESRLSSSATEWLYGGTMEATPDTTASGCVWCDTEAGGTGILPPQATDHRYSTLPPASRHPAP